MTTRRNFITGALGALSAMVLGRLVRAAEPATGSYPGETVYFVAEDAPHEPPAPPYRRLAWHLPGILMRRLSHVGPDWDGLRQPTAAQHRDDEGHLAGTLHYELVDFLVWSAAIHSTTGRVLKPLRLYAARASTDSEGKITNVLVEAVYDYEAGPLNSQLARTVDWGAALPPATEEARRIAEERREARARWLKRNFDPKATSGEFFHPDRAGL